MQKKTPKRYQKVGRPAWKHDGRKGRAKAGGPAATEPKTPPRQVWWCGVVGEKRVTAFDLRRDWVAAKLRALVNNRLVDPTAARLFATVSKTGKPTWVAVRPKPVTTPEEGAATVAQVIADIKAPAEGC